MRRQLPQMRLLTLALLVSPISAYTQDPSFVSANAAALLPPPAKVKFVLHGVDFRPKRASLQPDAAAILDEAVQLVTDEDGTVAVAQERVECVGSEVFNRALARRRARSVKEYLIAHGIAANRIVIDGPSQSSAGTPAEAGTAPEPNRQIELHIN